MGLGYTIHNLLSQRNRLSGNGRQKHLSLSMHTHSQVVVAKVDADGHRDLGSK